MGSNATGTGLESRVGQWRAYVLSNGVSEERAGAVEQQLRDEMVRVSAGGLDADETFLIALRRVAADDEVLRGYAARYSDEMWGAGTSAGPAGATASRASQTEFFIALGCAIAAAIAIKLPALFGLPFESGGAGGFYARNVSLFVLPFLALYLWWGRRLSTRGTAALAAVFVAGAVFVNAYPFARNGSTEILSAIHLPIVLWLAVGVVHAVGEWRSGARRMEYLRFTGEWLVTYALIALGGGVLVALTMGVFQAIGVDAGYFVEEWVLPCGAAGAVIIAGWLVASRRNLVGGMAPMLARVFTPLFTLMLVALLVGVIASRGFINVEREVLILLDLLLVVVLALVLYAVSARDPQTAPGLFDWIQLALVVCALGVDVFALVNIAARLTEFGFSPNRVAAIGLNLILLVNLGWSAWLQARALRARSGFEAVAQWQARYVPVYAAWAAVVVVAFPPLFAFV